MTIFPKPTPVTISNKLLQQLREEMAWETAAEYEKTVYILEFFQCDEEDIPIRIRDNEYGLTEADLGVLLNDFYSAN
jgi:hypothetical protein